MRKPNLKITKKQIVLSIIVIACLLLYGVTTLLTSVYIAKVPTQSSASTWDTEGRSEMISVFTSENNALDREQIQMLEYAVKNLLTDESIEAPNENARLIVDAYSVKESVSVSSTRASYVNCNAYYVGGDFFRFHAFTLVSGSYLQEDDFQKKGIVLDKDAAWKLFGAIDVDGMSVELNGREYVVMGIVEPDTSYKWKVAGAQECCVYLPIEGLEYPTITNYEIILPNPVTGFALKQMKSALGQIGIDDKTSVIISNSTRYDWLTSLKRAAKWNEKGMSFKEVKYPYWENQAIAVENVIDLLSVLRVLFLIPPVIILVYAIICFNPVKKTELLAHKIKDKLTR